ncbi:hypothetical protein HYFRA_00012888 [Hymenoscyphus fraxineus]|uniref:HD domain-containing protein n=1 Tax=Hymenoscyphus fraxineus TaxID=746836 RepID=A0A9N9L5E8_9HELO|nr:hypothetical protein HYFRA_00012888 [Hymenoscyphus fraxineus]
MANAQDEATTLYGWTAVPRDLAALIQTSTSIRNPAPVYPTNTLPIANPVSQKAFQHARASLPKPTFHHSLRVFYYGLAIVKHAFPSWLTPSFEETYFITCMFHDIGTTPENISATKMSFEFYGGYLAKEALTEWGGESGQVESVAESVIRHQDVGTTGTLSRMGALIQLATLFDNVGQNPELISEGTTEHVVTTYPRLGWSECFAATIQQENELKPWCHTTHLGKRDFPEGVLGNKLMEKWDKTGL